LSTESAVTTGGFSLMQNSYHFSYSRRRNRLQSS